MEDPRKRVDGVIFVEDQTGCGLKEDLSLSLEMTRGGWILRACRVDSPEDRFLSAVLFGIFPIIFQIPPKLGTSTGTI
ncbi:MAG: hypothetical protein R3211_09490 [Balneolaceae bacterium]|nr:hypothetical protein [Balneolaceae bacterium]